MFLVLTFGYTEQKTRKQILQWFSAFSVEYQPAVIDRFTNTYLKCFCLRRITLVQEDSLIIAGSKLTGEIFLLVGLSTPGWSKKSPENNWCILVILRCVDLTGGSSTITKVLFRFYRTFGDDQLPLCLCLCLSLNFLLLNRWEDDRFVLGIVGIVISMSSSGLLLWMTLCQTVFRLKRSFFRGERINALVLSLFLLWRKWWMLSNPLPAKKNCVWDSDVDWSHKNFNAETANVAKVRISVALRAIWFTSGQRVTRRVPDDVLCKGSDVVSVNDVNHSVCWA